MFYIYCPHCGEHREEEEFNYGGEAHIARPADPNALNDKEWAEYLFLRKNPRGLHQEMWYHAAGCRKFFNASRHTVTYEFKETYKIGEQGGQS
ncbi:sarcosine oxidase subunit delta [Oceanimonas smirnovii]|uniref:sarcosine oxidase subunit delta n=1 Tax=Oceanimonas smirnovii TaxID=264574 RepID=UPI003FD18779